MPTRVFALLATLVAGAPNPSSLIPQQLDDASDDIGWQFTRRRAPSADAEVAACVVGQARTLIYPAVQKRFRSSVLDPLRADSFVVLSSTWSSRVEYNGRVEPVNLTQSQVEDRLPAAAAYLDPVSSVLTDDDSLATAAPEAWRHCFNGTAPPSERSSCSPYTPLAYSWRGCLMMIRAAEAERSMTYRIVFRTRPDAIPVLPLAPLPRLDAWTARPAMARSWAAFHWDFAAIMTRDVADVSLSQFELAGSTRQCGAGVRWIPTCVGLDAAPHEQCNPCIVDSHGFQIHNWQSLELRIVRQCAPQSWLQTHPVTELPELHWGPSVFPACTRDGDAALDQTDFFPFAHEDPNVAHSDRTVTDYDFTPGSPYIEPMICACVLHED